MIDEVVKMLEAKSFEPFTIHTSGGDHHPVPSRDHAYVTPGRTRVVVLFDDETTLTVSGLHITAVGTMVKSGA